MSRYSHPSQQVTAGEPTSALDGLVGDTEVLREAERLRHHETLDDIIIVKNVTLLKKAQFGKEAVNVLNKVSFGVRPGMEVRCRHEVCQARSLLRRVPHRRVCACQGSGFASLARSLARGERNCWRSWPGCGTRRRASRPCCHSIAPKSFAA